MPGFERVQPIGEGLIRGPARLLISPVTVAFPSNLAAIVNILKTSGSYNPSIQSLSMTGTPAGGTFVLEFQGVPTATIPYNATSTQVQTALNIVAGIASQGNVVCTGGPLPGTPIVITFGVNGSQPVITGSVSGNLLTGGTLPTAVTTISQLGNGQYDVTPGSGWSDLGSTRGGTKISKNNTEDQLDIDQIYGSILGVPNEHEMTIATQFAENTLENIQLAWDEGTIILDATQTPNERQLPLGASTSYRQNRLAILHKKTIGPASGLLRAVVFRSVTRSAQNSEIDYQKTGQMQTLPHQFRAYVDPNISDPYDRFGRVIEQIL
jgi:hypothetical protein